MLRHVKVGRKLSAAIVIAGSLAVQSPCRAAAGAGTLTITSVSMDGAKAYIDATGGSNPEGCQLPNRYALPTDPTQRDAFLSAAMTALTSGMKFYVWVNGCATAPWGTVPQIYYFVLSK